MLIDKKKYLILTYFTVFAVCILHSQSVTYNHIYENDEVKEIQKLFENYLASKPEKLEKNNFWNEEEMNAYERYDFLEDEFKPSLYLGFPARVLSIKSNKGLYEIKVQYGTCESNVSYVLAIVNYYAKKVKNEWKLFNALTINREKWECTNVGYVDYYYPKEHQFNYEKANKLAAFIKDTCRNFTIKPYNFDYYFSDDYDEVKKLQGFDYWIGMGGEVKPSGKASERKLYCGGLGENFKHEVFHILTVPYIKNQYYWVTEGVAVFVSNENRGKPLEWHYKKIAKHIKNNPEIDFTNLVEYSYFDEYTDYHYAMGGFIASKIYKKGGWSMLKKFMEVGPTEEDYYKSIESFLGVKRKNLDKYLKQELEEYI